MMIYKQSRKVIPMLFVLCAVFLIGLFAAPAQKVLAGTASSYVDDQAGLLTEKEKKDLEAQIKTIQEKRNVDVAILTIEDRGAKTPKKFSEDYFDAKIASGEYSKNLVILSVSMNDRWVEIQGYHNGKSYITDQRVEKILDNMTYKLSNGQYAQGFSIYIDEVGDYLGNHPNLLYHTWLQIVIALVIGGVIVAIMVAHTSGQVTVNNRTYLDTEHSGLVSRRDSYITTTVRRIHIPKPQNTSSGGRSGGGFSGAGRSSGGHSHSGGGRHF